MQAVLGVILNKVDRKKQGGYYNKYYGKSYGKKGYNEYYKYEETEEQKNRRRKGLTSLPVL